MVLFFNNIRLDNEQKKALQFALNEVDADVYLFGSRTNLEKRGGDVDVFVLKDIDTNEAYKLSLQLTNKYQQICDERIDVIVLPPIEKMQYKNLIFFNSTNKVCLSTLFN
jgi:predicted nucleotidyltransferase